MTTSSSIFIIFYLCLPAKIFSLSFDMSPIRRSDSGRFVFSTDDSYVTDEGIQVTTNERNKAMDGRAGRAAYVDVLHLWDKASQKLADFSTHFSFVIDSAGDKSFGDGLAFFLAPQGSNITSGSSGRGLGLGNSTSPPEPPLLERFVAVEFDTFYNDDIDPPYDENMTVPHVGIDLNNVSSVVFTEWYNNVTLGPQNDAHVSYDSISMILRVDFTGTLDGAVTQRDSLSYEVDLRDYLPEYVIVGFSGSTGMVFEKNNVRSWNFSSTDLSSNTPTPVPPPTPPTVGKDFNKKKGLLFGSVGAGIFLFIIIIIFAVCFLLKKKNKIMQIYKELQLPETGKSSSVDDDFEKGSVPKKFTLEDLNLATDDFGEELGSGGFGTVYKGFLTATNTHIAVKKVSEGSRQGHREYEAEVKIISQVKHRNLVELIGWCHARAKFYIVYEYVANGSLDSHLFGVNSTLTWEERYRIAKGLASALYYLHGQLKQYILHRDIKASNVLLDSSFNAKLSDFGLARFVNHDKDLHTTTAAGTIGYMAPEYAMGGKASKEGDIYSFGILLLEIACGRRSTHLQNGKGLVAWVWEMYENGMLLDAADTRLESSEADEHKIERLMRVGLWCVHQDSAQRPSINQVHQVLNFDVPLPVLPPTMYNNSFVLRERIAVTSSSNTTSTATVVAAATA